MSERIELKISVPEMELTSMVVRFKCGESERWVKHHTVMSRTDGPWLYVVANGGGSATSFRTYNEAAAEASRMVVRAERERLILAAARKAAEGGAS